ncbi:YchJ family protein [Rubritalea tangerina]|uniref:YchJ family protein n=2 Tax=Rubritalea tangerina TaxID=430798 RepID=A0ABW4ZDZ2_9BACT
MDHQDQQEDRPLRIRLRSDCPCGSQQAYNDCCRPYHIGKAQPKTAEQLMRARYSAFFFRLPDFLVSTTHPDTREKNLRAELESFLPTAMWRSLNILSSSKGGPKDNKGKVEFVAQCHEDGQLRELYEHSRFRRHKGQWKYLDAKG